MAGHSRAHVTHFLYCGLQVADLLQDVERKDCVYRAACGRQPRVVADLHCHLGAVERGALDVRGSRSDGGRRTVHAQDVPSRAACQPESCEESEWVSVSVCKQKEGDAAAVQAPTHVAASDAEVQHTQIARAVLRVQLGSDEVDVAGGEHPRVVEAMAGAGRTKLLVPAGAEAGLSIRWAGRGSASDPASARACHAPARRERCVVVYAQL